MNVCNVILYRKPMLKEDDSVAPNAAANFRI